MTLTFTLQHAGFSSDFDDFDMILVKHEIQYRQDLNKGQVQYTGHVNPPVRIFFFVVEGGYSLPIEYYDSIKGQLSDSYLVIGQVWMLYYN